MQIPDGEGVPADKGSPQPLVVQDNVVAVVREAKPRPLVVGMRPAALSAKPNLIGLLVALRRRWLLAVSLGLLFAPAVAVSVWILRPVTFIGRTALHVRSTPERLLYDIPDGKGDFSNYQRAQLALVKSRLVLKSALLDKKVEKLPIVQEQEDQVSWLEKEIQADFGMAPEILRISMTGEDDKALPVIVDAVREAYLSEIVQKETKARQGRLDQLKKYFDDYDRSLRDKRNTLKQMARNLGSQDKLQLAATQEFNTQHLRQLQGELLKKESELRSAQQELKDQMNREKFAPDAPIPERTFEEQFKLNPVITRLQKEVTLHELDVASFKERSQAPEKEPGYHKSVQALNSAKANLAKQREQLRPTIVEQARAKIRDDEQVLSMQLNNRLKFMSEMKNVLKKEMDEQLKQVKAFKLEVVDLEWLQEEIAQLDTVNKEVIRQMQALEIEIKAPPRVSKLEDAFVVPALTESNRLRLAGGAGAGTFIAILFGIAFLEFRARRVSSADEVIQGLKMNLVGSLPLVPRRALLGRSSAAQNMEWQNRLTESVDAIRTTVLNAARFEGLRRVMVTSAVGGEGKTLLSCHLAVSLARAGCKTLLIDGDLRHPSVHKLFNLPLGDGLSELLRGGIEAAAVTNSGPLEGLSVITAGQSDSRAIQTLSHERLGELLKQLSENYEFVVIDSAPVLPVADAQLIGQHADGVVLSVMRDVSCLPTVYAACERLNLLRIRILGAVVNGMPAKYYQSHYHTVPALRDAPQTTEKETAS